MLNSGQWEPLYYYGIGLGFLRDGMAVEAKGVRFVQRMLFGRELDANETAAAAKWSHHPPRRRVKQASQTTSGNAEQQLTTQSDL